MGPEGAGLLYIHPERMPALRPNLAGWLSHERAADFLHGDPDLLRYDKPLKSTADVFEGGAPNVIGYAGHEGSVALIEQLGVAAIRAHVSTYLDGLESALLERAFVSLRAADDPRQSGILALRCPPDINVAALASELARRRVVASTPDGLLRFAPHWPNHLDEVARVIEAVDQILGR